MFYQLFLFTTVASSVHSDVTLNDCPPELPRNANLQIFGNSCYIFDFDHHYEFPTSESLCEVGGGHLVSIRDLATQNFLYHTVKDEYQYNGQVWIGLTDKRTEGYFEWIDGSAVTFTDWAAREPANVQGVGDDVEVCVYMDISDGGKWHDEKCEDFLFFRYHKPFICEYPAVANTSTTIPTTTPQPTTSPQPTTTQQPTTPQPSTTTKTPQSSFTTTSITQPRTTSKARTTTMSTTLELTTLQPMSTTTAECPPFQCSEDCRVVAYQFDDFGCLTCHCTY